MPSLFTLPVSNRALFFTSMPLRRFRLLVCAALLFAAPLLRAAPVFAQATSDLPADPAARFGTLPNGLAYVVLPNAEPKGRVSLRLLLTAGSFMENEDQRGLAHFLEHMSFNGSAHYAPGTLVEFFQRLGMSFGGDTNASTGFDQTVYMLELPDAKAATLDEGLQVFADYAGGLLLGADEIDKERGIILSEERQRDNVNFRTMIAEMNFILAGTRLPERIPIGLIDVIKQAPRARLVEFYDTWYRPDLMAVVVVGDVDVATVEAKIKTALGPVKARAPAAPGPDLGRVAEFTGVRAKYHPEPEAAATSVSISTVVPWHREPDTAATRRKDLPRQIAAAMLNRRLDVLAKQENAPFTRARTQVGENYNLFREAALDFTCKPDQWPAALAVADQELRRALQHGFQPAELREITASFLNGLEQAKKSAATRRSDALARELVKCLADAEVFTTPAAEHALYAPALATITPEDCLAALRITWGTPSRYVLVSGNAAITGDAEKAIVAAYEASRAVAVAPPATVANTAFAYTDFGSAGQIASRKEVADLGITLVTFANGVRLNLKPTDFEANRIRLTLRLGTGQLTEPRDQRGLSFFAGNTFTAGGLGRHSADELRRILAGKTVGVSFSVTGDAFVLGGATNRADLLLQLQLAAAHLIDPGYRPEAQRQARKGIEQLYNSFAHTPNGPLSTEVPCLLAGGDPRFGLPEKAAMLLRNLDEVQAWLAPQFARGAIELTLVGDFDPDAAIAAVAATFGALPTREPKPALEELRQLTTPDAPFEKLYRIPTEIPKGVIVLYWPTTDGRDVQRTRRLTVLADVLADRLRVKVREEIGGAYSPGAGSNTSEVYRNLGWITANLTVDPAKAQELTAVTVALADDLCRHGVSEDELNRARLPLLTGIRESLRNNGYWLNLLSRAQEKPEVLDWARTRLADVESITKADLDTLAQSYLGADRVFRVTVLPAQK